MANAEQALAALGDPTRRAVFERLGEAPRSVGELAHLLPVSRPAVSQHLQILKAAGLVVDRAEGTRRIYHIDPAGLGPIRAWLDRFWTQALAAFAAEIESNHGDTAMTAVIAPAPVRKSIIVKAPPQRAFEVFTAGMSRWWPATHSVNPSPMKAAIVEPRAGGRWFERGADGSECDWGRVLVWEPPHRLVLAWQIDGRWKYDASLVTEVELRFIAEASGGTRVELEHRNLERYAAHADKVRAALDSPGGWGGLLERFAATIAEG